MKRTCAGGPDDGSVVEPCLGLGSRTGSRDWFCWTGPGHPADVNRTIHEDVDSTWSSSDRSSLQVLKVLVPSGFTGLNSTLTGPASGSFTGRNNQNIGPVLFWELLLWDVLVLTIEKVLIVYISYTE